MTVSRVINGESRVRAETRDAVNAAIAQLNYAPNPAARSLAGAGQLRVALLYSNPSAGFLSEYLVGSLEQAARSDLQLIVARCDAGEHEIEVTRQLIDRGVDAMVLPPPLCDSIPILDLLRGEKLPTALVASASPPDDMLTTSIDNRAAAEQMTTHIVQLGHRRIGFIVGDTHQSDSTLRLEGFRAALSAAGCTVDETLIARGDYTYRSGLDAAEVLLDRADPPTAIFASNDDMAAATVAVAHRRGLDVPGDLTVCGFDDTTLSTAIWPELTTIHQPIADMACEAIAMLATTLRRKGDDGVGRHRWFDATLIRRQSDAPPRRRPRTMRA